MNTRKTVGKLRLALFSFVLISIVVATSSMVLAKATPASQPAPSSEASPATQAPTGLTVQVESVHASYGQTVNLTANVLMNGARVRGATSPQLNGQFSFYLDGQGLGAPLNPDNEGSASLSYQVPDSLRAGDHAIKVLYGAGPSTVRLTPEGTGTLSVSKARVKLSIGNVSLNQTNNGVVGDINLFRTTDNAGIDGRVVTISVDGTALGSVTTSQGYGSFNFKLPKNTARNSQAMAAFAGDHLYDSASASTPFLAAPPPPTPVVYLPEQGQTTTLTFGTDAILPVFLYKDQNHSQPISGEKLTLSVAKETPGLGYVTGNALAVTSTTDPVGCAMCKFRVTLVPGTVYQMGANFAGDRSYGPATSPPLANAMIVVNWGELEVTASPTNLGSVQIGQNVTVRATVKARSTGTPVPQGTAINFIIDGNTIATANTDAKGNVEATFPLTSSASVGSTKLVIQGPTSAKAECTINVQPSQN